MIHGFKFYELYIPGFSFFSRDKNILNIEQSLLSTFISSCNYVRVQLMSTTFLEASFVLYSGIFSPTDLFYL